MKKTIILIAVVITLVACTPQEKDYCSSTDKRFICTGYLGLDDNYILFDDLPEGVFTLQRPYLELEGEQKKIECTQVIKDDYIFNGIEKGRKYYFDCIPKNTGRYTMDIKIMHAEPPSYQPIQSETCVRIGDYQTKWQCTSSVYYVITVK